MAIEIMRIRDTDRMWCNFASCPSLLTSCTCGGVIRFFCALPLFFFTSLIINHNTQRREGKKEMQDRVLMPTKTLRLLQKEYRMARSTISQAMTQRNGRPISRLIKQ